MSLTMGCGWSDCVRVADAGDVAPSASDAAPCVSAFVTGPVTGPVCGKDTFHTGTPVAGGFQTYLSVM